MLSLIPALLLIAFHGPSAVERFGHEGRVPEALRKLEQVLAPVESDAEDEENTGLSRQRKAFASLVALSTDPAFSKAISELFGLGLELSVSMHRTDLSDLADRWEIRPRTEPSQVQTRKGFLSSRRTRDGPAA